MPPLKASLERSMGMQEKKRRVGRTREAAAIIEWKCRHINQ